MSRIWELESQILENTQKYYSGEECVSDEVFDAWIAELRLLDPNDNLLRTPGWGYKVDMENGIRHPYGFSDRFGRDKCEPDQIVTDEVILPKLDGGSVELIYVKGKFISAITRGDGVFGENASDKLVHMVPNIIAEGFTGSVLGEIVISDENLDLYYPDARQRNLPNGFLKRHNVTPEECNRFTFIAYKIYGAVGQIFSNRLNEFRFLSKSQFHVVPYVIHDENPKSVKYYMDTLSRTSYGNFRIDGLVVSDYRIDHKGLDENDPYDTVSVLKHRNEHALKIVRDIADTVVTGISWNLTRTRKYVPTLLIETREVSDANLSRVAGMNYRKLMVNRVGVGSKIKVIRSGDIIPHLYEVVEAVDPVIPEVCPSCGGKLVEIGANLECVNTECSTATFNLVYHWLMNLAAVDNLGHSVLCTFIDHYDLQVVDDIYDKVDDIRTMLKERGIGQSSIDLLFEMYRKLYAPHYLEEFLCALNIPGLGGTTAYKISTHTNLLEYINSDKLSGEVIQEMYSIKGITKSIIQYLADNWASIKDKARFVTFKNHEEGGDGTNIPSDRIKILISGSTSTVKYKKDFYSKYSDKVVEENNFDNLDYLICNRPGSSKEKTAIKKGIQVMTEVEFIEKILKENVNE